MSETEASLAESFINSYIRKSVQFCTDNVSRLFIDASNRTKLQKAVSAVVGRRLNDSMLEASIIFRIAQYVITPDVSRYSLTVRSFLSWMRELVKIDHRSSVYFAAISFLHVAYKTRDPLTDELLDVLATTSNDARRCRNARHSSVLSR